MPGRQSAKKSPKKSLGQNFLSDPKILSKIAAAAEIDKEDIVVEIGPGKGSLTAELLKRAKKVISIEKDEELARELENKFNKEITRGKLEIIVGDVLDTNLFAKNSSSLAHKFSAENLLSAPSVEPRKPRSEVFLQYKLVGNIPYYITGEIFRKFLQTTPDLAQPRSITFVIQKEVAERIMAANKKESILSISIKVYGKPKYGGIIKKGSFFPIPKVDSAIISVVEINKSRFIDKNIQEERFFEILKTGFAHKRKLLIKNLNNLLVSKGTFDMERLEDIFNKLGIDKKVRAEDLKVEDWFKIAEEIFADHSTKNK